MRIRPFPPSLLHAYEDFGSADANVQRRVKSLTDIARKTANDMMANQFGPSYCSGAMETSSAQFSATRGPNRKITVLGSLEDRCGAIFASLATIGIAAAILVTASELEDRRNYLAALGVGVWLGWWIFFDMQYLGLIWKGVRKGKRPLGLRIALIQRRPPLLLRPIVCLWWLAHFATAVLFALILAELKRDASGVVDTSDHVLLSVLTFLASLGITYSANGYLLLAITALRRSRKVITTIWSWRLLLDVVLSLVCVYLSSYLFN
ncbi:MAG: hypothetical protein ABSG31_08780 [Tepidisphaeraceae bacterium]|jgi:hypothetical protein